MLDKYVQHTWSILEQIKNLLSEADDLLNLLRNLDYRLDDIERVIVSEEKKVMISKKEVMSQLWTILGGNRMERDRTEVELNLLAEVRLQQKNAIVHVSGAMLLLQRIEREIKELQNRVLDSTPQLHQSQVPLSDHIAIIQSALERLGLEAVRSKSFKRKLVYFGRPE